MKSVLLILAHPNLANSQVNKLLIEQLPNDIDVTIHDLYECYPDGVIDIETEQELLRDHQSIVFQHPFYWYSSPSLLKEWLDLVLQFNFAYGPEGHALKGKNWLSVISTGAAEAAYQSDGHNRFTMRQLLTPFEQSAYLCGMNYLPPLVIHSAKKVLQQQQTRSDIVQLYHSALRVVSDSNFDHQTLTKLELFNQWEQQ